MTTRKRSLSAVTVAVLRGALDGPLSNEVQERSRSKREQRGRPLVAAGETVSSPSGWRVRTASMRTELPATPG